jgi:hypothetical protein
MQSIHFINSVSPCLFFSLWPPSSFSRGVCWWLRRRVFSLLIQSLSLASFLFQSWGVLVAQTESLSRVMRRQSEDLQVGPLSKLTLLIRDKQQLRKTYAEQWSQLSQELSRVRHTHTTTKIHTHIHTHTHTQTDEHITL